MSVLSRERLANLAHNISTVVDCSFLTRPLWRRQSHGDYAKTWILATLAIATYVHSAFSTADNPKGFLSTSERSRPYTLSGRIIDPTNSVRTTAQQAELDQFRQQTISDITGGQ